MDFATTITPTLLRLSAFAQENEVFPCLLLLLLLFSFSFHFILFPTGCPTIQKSLFLWLSSDIYKPWNDLFQLKLATSCSVQLTIHFNVLCTTMPWFSYFPGFYANYECTIEVIRYFSPYRSRLYRKYDSFIAFGFKTQLGSKKIENFSWAPNDWWCVCDRLKPWKRKSYVCNSLWTVR